MRLLLIFILALAVGVFVMAATARTQSVKTMGYILSIALIWVDVMLAMSWASTYSAPN